MSMSHNSTSNGLTTFLIFIVTQTISIIGSEISGFAVSIWVFNQTGYTTPLVMVSFFIYVPRIITMGFAGVLADRWNRKYVIALSDAGQALGTLLLLASFASGSFELWHLYVISAAKGFFGVFQGPAVSASVTTLIPDEQRVRANSILQLTGPISTIISPALAALLVTLIGVVGVIAIDLATFVLAVTIVLLIHIPKPVQSKVGQEMKGSAVKEFYMSVQYLFSKRELFYLMLTISLTNFLLSTAGVLKLPYILARTGSETTVGIMISVMSIGIVMGGAIMTFWGGTRLRIHTVMVGLILAGLVTLFFGMSRTPVALMVSSFFLFSPHSFINPALMSMLQIKIAPDVQGRVFAVMGQIGQLLRPLTLLMCGPLVDKVLEPSIEKAGWQLVAPFVGSDPGAGMGLLITISGLTVVILVIVVYAKPSIRFLEARLPDHDKIGNLSLGTSVQ